MNSPIYLLSKFITIIYKSVHVLSRKKREILGREILFLKKKQTFSMNKQSNISLKVKPWCEVSKKKIYILVSHMVVFEKVLHEILLF